MVKKRGFGKIVTVIGASLGLASVLLSLIFPELWGWYRFKSSSFGFSQSFYLTGFGTVGAIPPFSFFTGIAILVAIGGLLVILGSILCIVASVKKAKAMGFLGGVLIILGPILLMIDILAGISAYGEYIKFYLDLFVTTNVFWNIGSTMVFTYSWGIGIGFFMGAAGGVLGSIGGLAL